VLFDGEHEDYENEFGGKEHFDEEALGGIGAAAEGGGDVEWAWEESGDDGCGADRG